eukprot:CAMPEP_0170652860 /NCGR_PEP_ID=MMETSP0224-20130122/47114_1 /TAXON_ID=285029 /ORGANISM="Togula jolla, Strain CCCM 725" /LENGTH=1145 /DNA_ID=CAMNT_0010984723 /DNA_START=78 /DNA_END=3515 /DNA_ORIENTATION=-
MKKTHEQAAATAFSNGSRAGLIRRFNKDRERFAQFERERQISGMHSLATTFSMDIKPQMSCSAGGGETAPILADELELSTTHRGRVLLGRVAEGDAFLNGSSSAFLLEDICGNMVEVAVYNLAQSTPEAACLLPMGKGMAIFEPFCKVRQDGTYGVRVDHPAELTAWEAPAKAEEWKSLGNRFVRDSRGVQGALLCYRSALEALSERETMALLLSNASECQLRLGANWKAARFAAAATALDTGNPKAWLRLAKGLKDTGAAEGASRLLKTQLSQTLGSVPERGATATWEEAKWCLQPASVTEWEGVLFGEEQCKDNQTEGGWQHLRQQGGRQFAAGQFSEASQCYLKALAFFDQDLNRASILFSNMAAARLLESSSSKAAFSESPSDIEGLIESVVSALLDPLNAKAWMRQCRFLERLGKRPAAITKLEQVTEATRCKHFPYAETSRASSLLSSVRAELSQLQERQGHTQLSKPLSSTSTEQQLRDRLGKTPQAADEGVEDLDQYIARVEAMDFRHKMAVSKGLGKGKGKAGTEMGAILAQAWLGPLSKRKCPEFHTEYPKQRGWPRGLDAEFARKILYSAYLDCKLHPWHVEGLMRSGMFKFGRDAVIKRWHGTAPLRVIAERGLNVRPGDVVDARHFQGISKKYDARIRSSFANNPNRQETMFFGTTHVAVGFNDLGSLLGAHFRPAGEPELAGRPLRFVGLEMSEFSVAKASVVAELLGSKKCPISHVLQVRYSSGWSRCALKSFRSACRVVLAQLESEDSKKAGALRLSNMVVAAYLRHWLAVEPIPAEAARRRWFGNAHLQNRNVFGAVGSLRRQGDRLAMLSYLLTGELGDAVEVGSLCMWSVPEGSPPLEAELALNALPAEVFLEEASASPQLDLVALFCGRVTRDMQRVRWLRQSGDLTIQLYWAVLRPLGLSADGDAVAAAVAALRPYTFSWSNVIDYFELRQFHALARHCSQNGNAVHYAYSMNWTSEVFGTCIADLMPGFPSISLPDPEGTDGANASLGMKADNKGLSLQDQMQLKAVNEILDMALGPVAAELAKESGMDNLFAVPFFDTPLNMTSWWLCQEYHEQWLDHFFQQADISTMSRCAPTATLSRSNRGLTRGRKSMAMQCPFSRACTSVYMSWTYDPNLRLQVVISE